MNDDGEVGDEDCYHIFLERPVGHLDALLIQPVCR
jgi:hypothetical protein